MQSEIVDLSYLYEIAENDPIYISDVLEIFLSTIPDGVEKLKEYIKNFNKWDDIFKQAHFLKSSVSIVKVKDMYDNLNKIEMLAKSQKGKEEIEQLLAVILNDFGKAYPLLVEEHAKQAAAKPQS